MANSIFSSFLLSICQKTTVITHEQGKSPPPSLRKTAGSPSGAHRGAAALGFGAESELSVVATPTTLHTALCSFCRLSPRLV